MNNAQDLATNFRYSPSSGVSSKILNRKLESIRSLTCINQLPLQVDRRQSMARVSVSETAFVGLCYIIDCGDIANMVNCSGQ